MEYRFREEFDEARKYCVDVYGVVSNFSNKDDEDDWFTCPECDEPLLAGDWDTIEDWEPMTPWSACPICNWSWYDETYGNYEEEEDEPYVD